MAEARRIVMVCLPVERCQAPPMPSHQERCEECGAAVWVDSTVDHDACVCVDCARLDGLPVETRPHPQTLETLRRHGYSEGQIAAMQTIVEQVFGRRDGGEDDGGS